MIQQERIKRLNDKPVRSRGKYVLYWMQSAQRAEYNHALEFAVEKGNELSRPVVAVFGLTDEYPQANLRHYQFMLVGLRQTQAALRDRGIQLVIRRASPDAAAVEMGRQASMVVVDGGQLRIQRKWRSSAAKKLDCPLCEVEANLIVPVDEASGKEEFSAGTFRPRITSKLDRYLVKLRRRKAKHGSLGLEFHSFDITNPEAALSKLNIDKSVGPVEAFHGGTAEAKRRLRLFTAKGLDRFAELRNDPNADCVSNMSPYLHFGQISPLYIARRILKSGSKGTEAYLEELIVRRELSHNFVFYNNKYDTFEALPPWAKRTLDFHRKDTREYTYSRGQFEMAETHDPYWNAAQMQMLLTGKMHGYMRMYWGKKILEWSKTPQQAFKTTLYLNNKYELDGRDANAYAGIAWCFGKHDRAWGERPVFGKIRYMNAAGLRRKFDPDAYVKTIELSGKER